MNLSKPGVRLRSLVSEAEVIVVTPPSGDLDLSCGGEPMVAVDDPRASAFRSVDGALMLGKRYVDAESGLQVLCCKAGAGELTVGPRTLLIAGVKPLPSSD